MARPCRAIEELEETMYELGYHSCSPSQLIYNPSLHSSLLPLRNPVSLEPLKFSTRRRWTGKSPRTLSRIFPQSTSASTVAYIPATAVSQAKWPIVPRRRSGRRGRMVDGWCLREGRRDHRCIGRLVGSSGSSQIGGLWVEDLYHDMALGSDLCSDDEKRWKGMK